MQASDARERFLSTQLIAYIGNKRRLLDSLRNLFSGLSERVCIKRMLDPFAGSGAVSRLGKSMGFSVLANDWEEYARIINRTHLCTNPGDMQHLFQDRGGLAVLLDYLNHLEGIPAESYFSLYFAPATTGSADYRTERLFYTQENALFLDRIRSWIETEYPPSLPPESEKMVEREILLSMLLYEAATHANTSGVFKACHKGFGGHGKDALGRIMRPMELEYPVLLDGQRGEVGSMDAACWVGGRSVDLCYIDPPYTIHQYGSNYHLLNTLARWDKPAASLDLDGTGRLQRKAAIRSDWVETRSEYCRRGAASTALKKLLQNIDARFIVLSYNSDGIIPLNELTSIMSDSGRLELFADNYTQYRGGRQGLNRRNLTTEFQLVLTRGSEHRASDAADVSRSLLVREISILLRSSFHPERLRALPNFNAGRLLLPDSVLTLHSVADWRFQVPDDLSTLLAGCGIGDLETLKEDLAAALFSDNGEEARVLLSMLMGEEQGKVRRALLKRFLIVLRKLAHKKYRSEFEALWSRAGGFFTDCDWIAPSELKNFETLGELAERRFNG